MVMPGIEIVAPKAFDSLINGLRFWDGKKEKKKKNEKKRIIAINEIMEAVLATRAYLYDSEQWGNVDRQREADIAKTWQKAGMAIMEYDYDLWEVSKMKALGWSDPEGWQRVNVNPEAIKLDKIIEQCEWLLANKK